MTHQEDDVDRLLAEQAGVIARRQLRTAGLGPAQIETLLRRRRVHLLHPGVYIEHNGPPTWTQQAWGGVLLAGPGAALHLTSALHAAETAGADRSAAPRDPTIHVAVALGRRVTGVPGPGGIRVHRVADLGRRVQSCPGPPRLRYEDAVVEVAATAHDDLDAVSVLARAVPSRRTTAQRLRTELDSRARVRRRAWLAGVLDDVAAGACSVLEHGYQARVVRPHGLPGGQLQAPGAASTGRVLRDVELRELGLVVELDGHEFHSSPADRDRDLRRDLEAVAVDGLSTVRLGYRQVFAEACATAAHLGRLLRRLGCLDPFHSCPACPPAARDPGGRSLGPQPSDLPQ